MQFLKLANLWLSFLPAVISVATSVETTKLHINGLDIIMRLAPASPKVLTSVRSDETTLTKRAVVNACFDGCPSLTCSSALSTSPDPPLQADCSSLRTALQALANSELTTTFPCNLPSQASCPNFSVPPGFERSYTWGTCLVGFINLTTSNTLQYCDYLMAGVINSLFNQCVLPGTATGSFCTSSQFSSAFYALELRHV